MCHVPARTRGRAAILATAAATLALAACAIGPGPERSATLLSPHGAQVTVTVRASSPGTVRGELLAVGDSGLYVLRSGDDIAPRGVALVDYRAITRVSESAFGRSFRTDGSAPSDEPRSHLAAVSRFPQGLRGDLLGAVLRLNGQVAPARIP